MRNDLHKELVKAVHAFNEKIRYHENKGREGLPQREYARDLAKKIQNQRDYQREIDRLRRFGSADVTKTTTIGRYDNITITDYEKKEIQRQVRNINQRRKRKLEKVKQMDVTVAGKEAGYKRGMMMSHREAELAPKKLSWKNFGSMKDFEHYKKTLEHQRQSDYYKRKAEMFKENYIKALKTHYGENVEGLTKHIEKMNPMKFEDIFYAEQTASLEYVYIATTDDQSKLQNLYHIWGATPIAEFSETVDI